MNIFKGQIHLGSTHPENFFSVFIFTQCTQEVGAYDDISTVNIAFQCTGMYLML